MKHFFKLFIFFVFQSFCFSQSIKDFRIPDSLKNKNFEELVNSYDKTLQTDNRKAEYYANVILHKAKQEKKRDLLYDGYYKIARAIGLQSRNGHPYADSLLAITQNVNNKDYPANAYIIKGVLLYNEGRFMEALNYYTKAQNLAKNKNEEQIFYIKKTIAILKTATGEHQEATALFLEYYQYQKKKIESNQPDPKSYIAAIFSLANSYAKNREYHKSKELAQIGLAESKKYKTFSNNNFLQLIIGIDDYYLKNHPSSLRKLESLEFLFIKSQDYSNLSILYYYIGKIHYDTGKSSKAIEYFKKSDSVSFSKNEFNPIKRDGYEILIDYYKKTGDKQNQLKYIDKLIYTDSIINTTTRNLSKEIFKKYDTPILLEEKEKLISDLDAKNTTLYWILGLGVLALLGSFYFLYRYKKTIQRYKKQASLLTEKQTKIDDKIGTIEKEVEICNELKEKEIKIEQPKNNALDQKLQNLQKKIHYFEKEKLFLRKNITLDSLAKDLGTNRDYLSKSVNELKGKNFSQYLNELRIQYIIEELKSNEKIRKYTVVAIANEIGYNSSESFANAFRKITGTLPSYYIKALEQQNVNSD
ncbi:helix-turn-helix domain-containing protein [Chryseobacterium aquaticum]|uniref:Helix-turn-helix domain-containing protein n=1 Tax=Chryseobacterium aquaticum TaxID=452084 RepID=A0A848N469_9FLAO|nr:MULTISPECIES: helix-turn-helix domain-containing protein [Chryseobacterium]NMR33568.1 helix-turn-helix domain-containing protein [Chryseobacterium aquaticum]NRQ45642.1 helix-turn-helix domain-containing protein [Chryseobacterium sp. C-204]